jgi:pyruvate dehydrogenase E2 component (dihydrolipoamide acetyltransferase)
MADITMPKMGFDMEEGTIVRWLKQAGDEVKKGEPIAEIETDKVTIEIEAFESGTISEIVANEGETVPVGGTIAKLGGADGAAVATPETTEAHVAPSGAPEAVQEGAEDVRETESAQGQIGESHAVTSTAAKQTEELAGTAGGDGGAGPAPAGERVLASPLARRLAEEHELDLSQIKGSGPGGRIVRSDVEAALSGERPAAQPQPAATPAPQVQPTPEAAPAAPQPAEERPGVRREPLSRMRKTIARRLTQSKAPVPHFYVTSAIDMGPAMQLRKQLNASGDVKITVNDMVVKAAALALKKFPMLNATFTEDALEYHDYIHVSIAVATDTGLLAPAVTDVDKKSLGTLSAEAKELVERTRNGKATSEELQRGTFSVSNMGMYPVESFTAIINPPQSAILAVGTVQEEPVVHDGEITIGQIMRATVSVDHRVADGAIGAEYMQELKRLLENPMQILL